MIQARFSAWTKALVCISGVLLTFASGGCSGPRIDPEVAIRQERPVVMKGESAFLGGDVMATVTVSRGFRREQLIGEAGFRQTEAEQLMEQIQALNSEEKTYYQDVAKILNLEVRGSHMAPISTTFRLTNKTTREIEVQVAEFNSPLGNFAVQPGKVKLGPNETVEMEPMSSRLGFAGEVLPVKVSLKAEGKTDAHQVDVKSVIASAQTDEKRESRSRFLGF